MTTRSRGEALKAKADALTETDREAAGATYLEARQELQDEGHIVAAGECTLALAQLAADDFDLEGAHRMALLAADALVTTPPRQHEAYLLAGRTALASDAVESARSCFLAAAQGTKAWQALEALADLEFDRGDLNAADECLREAWARLPEDVDPVVVASLRERFGHIALERRDRLGALAAYECAIRSLGHCPEAQSQLLRARLMTDVADLYGSFGRIEDATRMYKRVHSYYSSAGLDRRAERIRERIASLRWPQASGE